MKLLNDFLLNYHHIGGRGGKFPINVPDVLRDGVDLTLYDADETCVKEAKNSSFCIGFNSVEVFPFCVSDKDGFEDFIITMQPNASSLLKANFAVYPFIRNSSKFGAMRLQEILMPYKSVRLESKKLSSVLLEINENIPEFISLDTQGNEFDIINSSKDLFHEGVLLVNTEISFSELYKNQKNFPEIHNLMMDLGFILIDIKPYDPHHCCFTPIDFEGKGFLLDGEAFYIKKPDLDNWGFKTILKYCFAALLCEQTHLCISVFDTIKSRFPGKLDELSEKCPSYINLIKDLYNAYHQSYKAYLPLFHESETYKQYHNKVASIKNVQQPELDLLLLKKNCYIKILIHYGLNKFAKKIENQTTINIQTINQLNTKVT